MNVDELWRGLGNSEELPTAAIEASLEHWVAVSPRFLSKLRAFGSTFLPRRLIWLPAT